MSALAGPALVQVPWEPGERTPFPVRRDESPPNPRRRWELLATAALAALLVIAAAAAIGGGTRPPPKTAADPSPVPSPAPSPTTFERNGPPSTGVLAYVSEETVDGTGRLWLFDPVEETVTRGPAVSSVTELVGGTLGHYGAISRGVEALALDSAHDDELPYVIAAGEMVAWSGDANTVVVQSRRSVPGSCPASVIRVIYRPRMAERLILDRPDCRALTAMGVDNAGRVFVTRTRAGHTGVYRVSQVVERTIDGGRYRRILDENAMLGVSPRGDLLTTPLTRVIPAELVVNGPPLVVTLRGELPVVVFDGPHPLLPERVLAWSPDGRYAAVLGRGEFLRSVWLVQLRPDPVLPPVRTAPALGEGEDDVQAAFGPGGTLYEVIGGRLYRFDGTTFAQVLLPQEAPPITGPIAWLEA